MQTSKRAILIILACCVIITISYRYYKKQYVSTLETPVVTHQRPSVEKGSSATTTLSVGATQEVSGVRMTLESITKDSRCPVDVQCIQAGNITANMTLVFPQEIIKMDLTLDVPISFGDYDITITNVTPLKKSAQEIKTSDYEVTLLVVKVSDEEKKQRQPGSTK